MNKSKLMNIAPEARTRDLNKLTSVSGNLYKSIVIMSKRSNQINASMKEELHAKLNEFASSSDNLEEVFENREQIEISKYYERLPNPAVISLNEFTEGEVYFRNQEDTDEKE